MRTGHRGSISVKIRCMKIDAGSNYHIAYVCGTNQSWKTMHASNNIKDPTESHNTSAQSNQTCSPKQSRGERTHDRTQRVEHQATVSGRHRHPTTKIGAEGGIEVGCRGRGEPMLIICSSSTSLKKKRRRGMPKLGHYC